MMSNNPLTLTIYTARCRGTAFNNRYPDRHVIASAEDLREAAQWDHVCATYRNGHRKNENFICSDCLPMDLDNGHSDDPKAWKDLDDVREAFPGVPFYAVPSRNHMAAKENKKTGEVKSPRPRYHVYFPIDEETDWNRYKKLKAKALRLFPWFDDGAADAARFLYGVEAPEVIAVKGDKDVTLTAFLEPLEAAPAAGDETPDPMPEGGRIPIGQRNSTLSHLAGQLLKRYGLADDRARAAFDESAGKCDPPLEDDELETIWKSAVKFYKTQVLTDPDYIPPDEYAGLDFAPDLIPRDFSDVGEADTLARLYRDRLRYSDATEWIVYDGARWIESNSQARERVHNLTRRQLDHAREMKRNAVDALMRVKEAEDRTDEDVEKARKKAQRDSEMAEKLHSFARQWRRSARISATLTEAAPYLQVSVNDLDGDAFQLNTPAGTVDLRTGEMHPHNPDDLCTKLTGCAPGSEGRELFDDFLERVTCGDAQLRDYLQMIAGMFTVGAVYRECLIIAYGGGGNGKSTLFNLLAYVMGDYAGNLSAETLTMNCRKNKSPEYAELRGRRLVIAAELEEGMRFDTAIIKKLCSTDPIFAEKKFKAPFSFIPSHTLVLYTNHLPRVGTMDRGTWDRLTVVPFKANFRGQDDEVLNYGRHLFEHAGGAVLAWMIEGARRFIEARYRIPLPDCVRAAIDEYRTDNDWLQQFLETCCDVEPNYRQPSGTLYAYYRQYCAQTGEYVRHSSDFKQALLDNGFDFRRTKSTNTFFGLRLKPAVLGFTADFIPAEDPLE